MTNRDDRERLYGQYGNESDMGDRDMERDLSDSSGYNMDHNSDVGRMEADRGNPDRGGYSSGNGFGDTGAGGRTPNSGGAGNSYQRGLGGLSGNQDQGRYGSGWRDGGGGASDRDMGNLERDPYGRGSAARGGDVRGGARGSGPNQNPDVGDRGVNVTPVGQHYGRGPRGYARSDERITEEVNEQLTYHHDIDATDIEVQVQGGEVTLVGHVPDRRQKRMAEDVAESVRGVRDVHNQLRVGQGGASGAGMSQASVNPAVETGETLVVTPDDDNR